MTAPVLANTRAELAEALKEVRSSDGRVAFVPTMGALHEGHASLIRTARDRVAGPVVVSIFVNPMQFAPGEDLDRYPRTLEADLEVCAANGADVAFAPTVDEVYPGGEPQVTVDPGPLATILDGRSRPTHFHGVLTVVAKLFGLVRPDVAVFGEKDYQQLALIRRMVRDLCMGIDVVGAETVREADGLALSSRNRFLDPGQRQQAVALSRALQAAQRQAAYGADAALAAAHDVIDATTGVDLDYLSVTSTDLGDPPDRGRGPDPRRGPGRLHPAHRQPAVDPRGHLDRLDRRRRQLMLRTMMKSKIHRATVTQADLHYVGSVTVDEDLLDAADLLVGELVHIVDVTNGARLETYTIAGERGSGVLGINGAAARLVHPGDVVILIGYGQMETAEARAYQPHVVFVDAENRIVGTGSDAAETFDEAGLVRGDLISGR